MVDHIMCFLPFAVKYFQSLWAWQLIPAPFIILVSSAGAPIPSLFLTRLSALSLLYD
jgi:hypothetical protein